MGTARKLLATLLFLAAACGKRGDPSPPVPVIPKATNDLVLTQRGPKLVLTWSYPSVTTAGKALGTFSRVVIYRYVEPLPAATQGRDLDTIAPGDVDPTQPAAVKLFSKIPAIGPVPFLKLAEKLDRIEGSALAGATQGARLVYDDTPPFHSSDGRPVRLTYAVVTEAVTGRSALSNLAIAVPIDVPAPPSALTAVAKPEGVELNWQKPVATITGGAPSIGGYNVYRSLKGGPEGQPGEPVNTAPVASTSFLDHPPYGTFNYHVSAVSTAAGKRIESDPSGAADVVFKDLLPPPVPGNLAALIETGAVRLVWDPVDAADLKGYFIYRTEGVVKLKLNPYPSTAPYFRDISIQQGVKYFYSVTSVDQSGNESKPAVTGEVMVPKSQK